MKKLLVVIAVALTGCDSMSAKDFKRAEQMCEVHGGLKRATAYTLMPTIKAYCSDGRTVEEGRYP